MNWMVLPNQVCLIVKLYNNRPGLLPDSNATFLIINHQTESQESIAHKLFQFIFTKSGADMIDESGYIAIKD